LSSCPEAGPLNTRFKCKQRPRPDSIHLPLAGRGPGWQAGLVVTEGSNATESWTPRMSSWASGAGFVGSFHPQGWMMKRPSGRTSARPIVATRSSSGIGSVRSRKPKEPGPPRTSSKNSSHREIKPRKGDSRNDQVAASSLPGGGREPPDERADQQPGLRRKRNVRRHADQDPNRNADQCAQDGKPNPPAFSVRSTRHGTSRLSRD
jgi:hypothetical protein